MAIRTFRPITPGLRHRVQVINEEITSNESNPVKSLTRGKKSTGGRASNGRISVRHHGGGHKRRYRVIDFRRDKFGVPGKVTSIEYDPNRSANIALITYVDGEKRYILAPKGLQVGQTVLSGPDAPAVVGNALPLERIPVGFTVHNVELTLGKGGQLARAAGVSALIAAQEGDYVVLKLPSGEQRMVFKKCMATIGQVGNDEHMNERIGKAGRTRWL
ncbi:MAG: 50S ribosomal protein L2, partial [Spirochaetales bacterium]|nr:50S ribosomal protein L2 [Spirochaetales bacterium]